MKKSIVTLSILAVVFCTAGACKSSENATQEASEETEVMTNGKDITTGVGSADNMTMGTIVYSDKEGDCEYVIKTDDGRMFDPINMDKSFYKDGMKVQFTFGPLRMANRCEKANPISLEEIKTM